MTKNNGKFPKNIIDIKFCGKHAYVLKEITLTSIEVENQLEHIKYTGQGRKKNSITENQVFPPFALAFFKLLFKYNKIPNENELLEFYAETFFQETSGGDFSCDYQNRHFLVDIESFKGRILRSYPSLIRDYHFFLKCTESKYFDKVIYSLKDDYYEGIDITIFANHIKKHISLHVKTTGGKYYKVKKESRHNYYEKNEIVLEMDLNHNSKKISDFYLYPDETIDILINKVEEEKANYSISNN